MGVMSTAEHRSDQDFNIRQSNFQMHPCQKHDRTSERRRDKDTELKTKQGEEQEAERESCRRLLPVPLLGGIVATLTTFLAARVPLFF